MTYTFNDTRNLQAIQGDYFVRMMLPEAEANASPYVEEESSVLDSIIKSITDLHTWNFIVVGAGALWYIEKSLGKTKSYIAIEPLAEIFIQKHISYVLDLHNEIKVVNKEFGDFNTNEIGTEGNSIFVFHFNILSYIQDPIGKINQYLKKNDILYISTWGNSPKAKKVRKDYFDFINDDLDKKDFKIDPTKPIGLCNLDAFPFKDLNYYESHKRIKGEITDILIIKC